VVGFVVGYDYYDVGFVWLCGFICWVGGDGCGECGE